MDPSEETEEWAVWYDESHSQTLNMVRILLDYK